MRRALRVVVPIVLVACLTAAAALAGLIRLPDVDLARLLTPSPPPLPLPTVAVPTGSSRPAAISAPSTRDERAAAPAASGPRIEVARLDPEGASVIAGRAPGGSRVTLYANGQVIAEVTASDDGQWSAIVTKGIAAGQVDLTITAGAQEATSARSPVLAVVVPPGTGRVELATAPATARPILPQRAPSSDAPAIGELAALLAKARAVNGLDGSAGFAQLPPITFVTGEATLTAQGHLAASLLAAYLRNKASKAITLSGHADERGTEEFNIELSRQRLATVERRLRTLGYGGRVSLLPKGKAEPFKGIDRRAAPPDEVMQADRRVELRASE